MKALLLASVLLAATTAASAAGVYYFNSHATIVGSAVFPVGATSESYTITATTSIGSVSIAGDPQFTLYAPLVPNLKLLQATLSFHATLGGDYSTTMTATSTSAPRTYAGRTAATIKAHMVGANYALTADTPAIRLPDANTSGTATFTLTSTGETALTVTSLAASTPSYGSVSVAGSTTPFTLAPGASRKISVTYAPGAIESDNSYFSTSLSLGLGGNTRTQAPVTVSVFVPLAP
jgi:hypothetical protein